jgi:surface antigen
MINSVQATQQMITPTLNRVEVLIQQARDAGKQASEGAVSGVFTGVVKLPTTVLSNMSNKIFGSDNVYKDNADRISKATSEVINSGVIGTTKSWKNDNTGATGTVTLQSISSLASKECRILAFYTKKSAEWANTAMQRSV